MATIGTGKFDSDGRPYRTIVGEDSSGNKYVLIVDSDGHTQVDVLSITAGSNRIGIVLEDPHEVRVAKAIDASIGAYADNDVVNDDDCSVTASCWEFTGMANAIGGYGVIDFATIFSETENIAPRLTLILFNAIPTGELTDNSANTSPIKADRTKYVGEIAFPALADVSASIASIAVVSPSTVGKLPIFYKCAAASTSLFAVLKTLDAFTQTATDDIEITLQVKHL